MQEALAPEMERACGNPECDTPLSRADPSKRTRDYCCIPCRSRAGRLRLIARNQGLVSKACATCGVDKPMSAYLQIWLPHCADCGRVKSRARYRANGGKERVWAHSLANNYGMTVEQYKSMAAAQDHKCALCRRSPDHRLHVDHNHATGKVRQLLCRPCNYALGNAQDDPALLRAMAEYLERHGYASKLRPADADAA